MFTAPNKNGNAYKLPVKFQKIVTPQFIKGIDALRVWDIDIRNALTAQALSAVLAEEDQLFIHDIFGFQCFPFAQLPRLTEEQRRAIR